MIISFQYRTNLSKSTRLNQSTATKVMTSFKIKSMKKSMISATTRFHNGGIVNSCHSSSGVGGVADPVDCCVLSWAGRLEEVSRRKDYEISNIGLTLKITFCAYILCDALLNKNLCTWLMPTQRCDESAQQECVESRSKFYESIFWKLLSHHIKEGAFGFKHFRKKQSSKRDGHFK